MNKLLLFLLSLTLILTGCSATISSQEARTFSREVKQNPPVDFIPRDVSVVAVGDSLTQGVGDIQDLGGYIPYLQAKLEASKLISTANFQNFGVRGNRSDQLLKRLNKENVKTAIVDADLVIITIGGNDIMQVFKENMMGLELNKFVAAENGYSKTLHEIFMTIRQYNNEAGIVLIGIYNPFIKWFSDIKEMSTIVENWNQTSLEEVSNVDRAIFVPIANIFENNEESLLYTDYFHPNNRGYELIGDRIFSQLENENLLKSVFE
ncbi:SGNH/GDSL hydrolase family protein [Bacillus sp. FSL K6-3431]|uniref:SGNH/GDSL hydrolase family protein n=1 Tax=Bacillus sp. FSL K6-3431 TaxID=2921500 RepID=UPI0030F7001D